MIDLIGKKVAVIRAGGIGDILLLLPVLRGIKSGGAARLDLITNATLAGLMSGFRCLDTVFTTDQANLWQLYSPASKPVKNKLLAGYDLILAFMIDRDGDIAANLKNASRGKVVVIPPFPADDDPRHISRYYSETVLTDYDDSEIEYDPAPEESGFVPGFLDFKPGDSWKIWAIHPGSGGLKKNWPLAGFAAVADGLIRLRKHVVIILGPAEEEGPILSHFKNVDVHIARGFSLQSLAALLRRCGGYIGNDSGITHLAAALGIPTLALFVCTDPQRWGPVGNRVRVLCSNADGADIGVSCVIDAVLELEAGGR